jgi:UDP-2,3-diacylglucosamine hydrolase
LSERLLFISDLHLEEARPDITAAFLQFLRRIEGDCTELYILGDLFEVWIGDDEVTELSRQIADALSQLASTGSKIHLMHGNRDFLLGTDYATLCGASLIAEPFTVRSGAEEFLLLHGDSLCTDDVDYQQFRQMVREPQWQAQFLAQPLKARRDFARQARAQSQAATAGKEMGIMDVNPSAVVQLLQDTQHTQLIHGHTHRPARHEIALQQPIAAHETAVRMVLGDWDKQGWFAQLQDGKLSLQHFPL